jgi:hypothetical protein
MKRLERGRVERFLKQFPELFFLFLSSKRKGFE